MINEPDKPRHPIHTTWPCERLLHEHAIAIACAVEPSSTSSYSSAVNSYFTFCPTHSFPVDPTPKTLSFYAVYTAHYIKPDTVSTYLSSICNQLEPFFPEVCASRHHWLVKKTLAGCKKMLTSFNDSLFLAMLLTGFHGLMHLGELTWPNSKQLQDYQKVIFHNSLCIFPKSYQFILPGHKADRFFQGNLILIQSTKQGNDPYAPLITYLTQRDHLFPLQAELWLKEDGTIPTRAWFLLLLRRFFPGDVSG
jgi:hypothetical protein